MNDHTHCPGWCEVETPHTRHEQVVGTWLDGCTVGDAQHPLHVQLVRFAYTPHILGPAPVEHLALTIIDPRSRLMSQQSVVLPGDSWRQVARVVDETAASR